jgi:hypothetical protein
MGFIIQSYQGEVFMWEEIQDMPGEIFDVEAVRDEETRFIELAYDLMMEGEMDEDAIYDEVHRIMDMEDAQ